MTRADIIRMAIEAELVPDALWETPELERFAALVAAAEREACAQACAVVCTINLNSYGDGYNQGAIDCEKAIKDLT
jgi:hypothetical protein